MSDANLTTSLRTLTPTVAIMDIVGEITGYAEDELMNSYTAATSAGAQTIILNFSGLDYMNSSGIGLLVTMLIRVQRQQQRLMAYGLMEHYQQIFSLTRLNEAIAIFADEASAVAAAV